MAQGKEWNKDEVIEILRPYFQLGCNVTKACAYAGVSRTTVQTWIEDDEILRLKVQGWQNEMSTQARRNWKNKLDAGDFTAANEWLSKKEKDEFSNRTELTGEDGDPLIPFTNEQALSIAKSTIEGAGPDDSVSGESLPH